MSSLLAVLLAGSVAAQKVGDLEPELHPKLSWKKCNLEQGCETVQGEITIDSNWRWLRDVNGYNGCIEGGQWLDDICSSNQDCTENCALEGATYEGTYGIRTNGHQLSMRYFTPHPFSYSVNSRVFLMDTEETYQMFTLMGNEIAVDVDLSTVECGINSALYFVAMEADGGKASYPTNKAGAKYGTGYCDANCPRSNRFNGGQANFEGWVKSPTDDFNGDGNYGACCAEFDVLNSNAHSYSLVSKPCIDVGYEVCKGDDCSYNTGTDAHWRVTCDNSGCDYSPYRLGLTDFYGRGKIVDTNKNFTVVTRFEETGVTQFFLQDGKRIEVPAPADPEIADTSGLTEDYCFNKPYAFGEYDRFNELGGFFKHNEALRRPMVLAMAITDDHWRHNLWLDSQWPLDSTGPGTQRGPCIPENNDPLVTKAWWRRATVVWSNIRFGPVGSTVDV